MFKKKVLSIPLFLLQESYADRYKCMMYINVKPFMVKVINMALSFVAQEFREKVRITGLISFVSVR